MAPSRVSGKEEEMREGKRRGRYVVYERGLLRSRATVLEGGPSCCSSDDLGEALGMLDVVLEFGLQGFVHDSERNEVLDPLGTEGWVRL